MARMQKTQQSKFIKIKRGVDQYHEPSDIDNDKIQAGNNIHLDGSDVLKRPGKKPWGPLLNSSINGMFEYIDKDGAAQVLVATKNELLSHSKSSSTVLDTLPDEKIYFHTQNGICFYNSINTQKKLVSSTVSDVGLARPTTAPTIAAGAAGVLTGDYAVKVSYETADGLESNLSDLSNSVTLSAEKLDYTNIPISPDSRVTKRNLYRTTAGGASVWYIATIEDNTTTTYTDNLPDAETGDLGTNTRGVPNQGAIAEGCNNRQFWIGAVNQNISRFSEIAITDNYLEYQKSTNFKTFTAGGVIKGHKSLYNGVTQKEDLYYFGVDSIHILPGGDPNEKIQEVTTKIGILQQNTIAEYDGKLIFMSNKNSVHMMRGREVINISNRSILKSLKAARSQENCSAGIIFDHFYALTIREQKGKLYNTKIWVCDLRTVAAVQLDQAEAVWFPYELDAQYILQRADGTVLYADTNDRQIYELNLSYTRDIEADGSKTDWLTQFRTKNLLGNDLMTRKQPRMISVDGSFQRSLVVVPYAFKDKQKDETLLSPVVSAAVMGQYVMGGGPSTILSDELEESLDSECVGNTFSFDFYSGYINDQGKIVGHEDAFFKFNGFNFTYKAMVRNI